MIHLKIKKNIWYDEEIEIIDEVKASRKCIVSSCERHEHIDTTFACFWCRLIYDSEPIHCPIQYHPPQISKNFTGKNENIFYTIKGNVYEDEKLITDKSYFEVDGSFCSFSCCLAFIRDNKKNPIYFQSETLLNVMTTDTIIEAPHWRLLKNYGGPFSEEEFKKMIGKDNFKQNHNIVFLNHLFEKNFISK